ncbi:hypothetical protein FA13DRAFT_1746116 [Coprinellus micaceus]|uniref:Nephrocystin 3-like N-terminal domain-containing protein n=1 Tax=Coprinellus micaceus TaxID=71717 RepID=A0A4Y7SBW6_COPMI|nr:hypothetical protein FA13DRAFT_1746116 [Coprinellus micaceus]
MGSMVGGLISRTRGGESGIIINDNSHHNHGYIMTTIQHANTVNLSITSSSGTFVHCLDKSHFSYTEYGAGGDDLDINESMLWVYGPAGTGKSTLARQLAIDSAASLFLSVLSTDTFGPDTAFRLIGAEIGRFHHKAIPAVAEAARLCHGAALPVLVEMFIRKPLESLHLPHPLIIVMDAADEWRSHYHFITELESLSSLPSLVRFVVLSRSEPRPARFKGISIRPYHLEPVSIEVMQRYLHVRFEKIEWPLRQNPQDKDVLSLATMANKSHTLAKLYFDAIEMLEFLGFMLTSRPCKFVALPILAPWSILYRCCSMHRSRASEPLHRFQLPQISTGSISPRSRPTESSSGHTIAQVGSGTNRLLKTTPQISPRETTHPLCYRGQVFPALEVAVQINPYDADSWTTDSHALDVAQAFKTDDCVRYMRSLARSLWKRAERLGTEGDIEAAILRPSGHPDRSRSLANLATSLHSRFKLSDSAGDLDEAIVLQREVLELRPSGHPDRSWSLNNLATSLHSRFEPSDSAGDLEEAIVLHREALGLRPSGHPDRFLSLNNLAASLHSRFKLSESAGDLEEAIVLHREALELRPSGHPNRSLSLYNLASTLHSLFQTSGHVTRGAPATLWNLRICLYDLFKARGTIEDLHEAVSLAEEALAFYPADSSEHGELEDDILLYKERLAE